jgi:hypothetical protein
MRNLIGDASHADVAEALRADLFAYLEARGDPRMSDSEAQFTDTPYFGFLFELGLLNWSDDRDGRRFSEAEISELLRQAYEAKGEEEAFRRVARREGWND